MEAVRAKRRDEYRSASPEAQERRRQRDREYYLAVEAPRRQARRKPRVLKRELPCLENCGRLVGRTGSKGRCQCCNQRIARAKLKAERRPCVIDGCPQFVRAVGQPYCDMHRSRVRRYGDPGSAEPLIGARGEWHLNKKGYRVRVVNRRQILEHRFVMEQMLGRPLFRHEHVHHKNGDRACNEPSNLELWAVQPKVRESRQQPKGQRVVDLVAFVAEFYPEMVGEALAAAA